MKTEVSNNVSDFRQLLRKVLLLVEGAHSCDLLLKLMPSRRHLRMTRRRHVCGSLHIFFVVSSQAVLLTSFILIAGWS